MGICVKNRFNALEQKLVLVPTSLCTLVLISQALLLIYIKVVP